MKLKVLSIGGTEIGNIELPVQFLEPVREDLIKKAVLAIQNNKRQAYGAFEKAGKRSSVRISKKRRDYRGSYGRGISRVPRKVLSRRGTQMYWVGAFAPGTVGGRKAHPPKAKKVWEWKINIKEKRKAIRSAMNASMNKELVVQRGHLVPKSYPFVLEEKLETISKTKDLLGALRKLGFKDELRRAGTAKIRSGKGKLRGRKKKIKKSVLLVVSDAKQIRKAGDNIPGVDVVNIKRLNTEVLAPGAMPGRAAIFTTRALEILKSGLFLKDYKGESKKKVKDKKPKKMKKVKKVKKKKEKPKQGAVKKVEVKAEAKK
ncbi:50S ribosomal protein L4 [Candidatus Woesearchaeota archaeon]|nr:50S ribosomal protein L4 [Candidatus Woesearchaeota archaeon]